MIRYEKEENAKGSQKWIEKPEIKVCVFRFSGKFDIGFFQSDFFIRAAVIRLLSLGPF